MRRAIERLYHLTEASNVEAIRRDGLLSTERLLERSGASEVLQAQVRGWRPEAVRLPDGVLIGDQWCQPPQALARCLTGGLTPQDWYDRLNGFVYLWPGERAALAHANTYKGRDQRLLVFDAVGLLKVHSGRAFVTSFNVGYALRRAKVRGLDAFQRYEAWLEGGPKAKEVVVEDAVTDAADHLLEIRML